MATTPTNSSPLEEDRNCRHELPGHTVDALLAKGKIDEARDELGNLLLAGLDSGPGRPMNESLYEELVSNIRSRAAAGKP